MKNSIELYPQALSISEEGQRRSCIVREISINGDIIETELWIVYPLELPMLEDDNCDSYLLGILLLAMHENANIRVYGSVSKKLLANLTELQYIWNRWCPGDYSLVEINVDHIRKDDLNVDGAVFAFSGGVDAQFTAYRHAKGLAGYCTQQNKAAVLIHGFDIPLSDTEGLAGAATKAVETLNSIGVNLLLVKTNLKDFREMNWGYSHGFAIASVLSGLSRYAGTGMIGSGEPYEALETPWGSHPMTDPLLSSDSFKVIHDGAGFSRSEKVKVLSDWTVGMKNLRVCWEGELKGSNCGRCEKCVRTRLNFILADVPNPECFNTSLSKKHFKPIVLHSGPAKTEWNLIRNEMKHSGKGIKWLPEIEKVIERKPKYRLGLLLPPNSQRRLLMKRLLKKI